jgi:predicted DNA-binding transcriptional regulator AlpA
MKRFLRYKHLEEAGIVNSRPSLNYKIKHDNFPAGVLLGPNTRAWPADEVEAWIASRPVGKVARTVSQEAREKATAARLKLRNSQPDRRLHHGPAS